MLTLMKKLWTSRNKKQHIIYGMYFSEQQGLLHSRETLLVWWGTHYSHCPALSRDLWPLEFVDEAYSGSKCGCWQIHRSFFKEYQYSIDIVF